MDQLVLDRLEPVTSRISRCSLPLPYPPGSINCYFVHGDDGTAIIDTGIYAAETVAAWERLLEGPLSGLSIGAIVVTHWHSDHIGMAGWLSRATGAPLHIAHSEYERAELQLSWSDDDRDEMEIDFQVANGANSADVYEWIASGFRHMSAISALPDSFIPVQAAGPINLAGVDFDVLTLSGHSPAATGLLSIEQGVFLCGDHLSDSMKVSVTVSAADSAANPLGAYFDSLKMIAGRVPAHVLVLPGHNRPFSGLHRVLDAAVDHHLGVLNRMLSAANHGAKTAFELSAQLVRGDPGPLWRGYVLQRAIGYAHYLESVGLFGRSDSAGVIRFSTRQDVRITRHTVDYGSS